MDKTGVFFLSHIFNDFTIEQYNNLKQSLLEDFDLFWVYTNKPEDEEFFAKNNIGETLHIQIGEYYIDYQNKNHVNNIVVFLGIYDNCKNYDYYWFIEYDVKINTKKSDPFKNIFSYYNNDNNVESKADLLADHINSYITQYVYADRYKFHNLRYKYYDINTLGINYFNIHFGFYSICRLSNKLLEILNSDKRWKYCFFEWGITTCAYMNCLDICSFQQLFSFPNNKYEEKIHKRINNGSNSFIEKPYKDFYNEWPEGCIIHPVKSKNKSE